MADYLNVKFDAEKLAAMSNLGFAHIGDCVYELLVRTWLCSQGHVRSSEIHRLTVSMVAAPAQAQAMEKILPLLTEEEEDIYRRGRNTRVNSVPHASTLAEYHAATGLEMLFGKLYLEGKHDRINELFSAILEEE